MSRGVTGAQRDPRTSVVGGKNARPTDITERQRRAAAPALTPDQQAKPDLERALCGTCSKYVRLRADGTMAGHQATRGISCAGATPRTGDER